MVYAVREFIFLGVQSRLNKWSEVNEPAAGR